MSEPADPFRFDNYEASPEPKKKPVRPRHIPDSANWEPRQCKFCDEIFECSNLLVKDRRKNQLTKIRHHTLNHFKDKLALLLPKEKPWNCPMPNCEYIGKSLLDLIRHYAFVHNQIADYCNKEDLHGIAVESEKNLASTYKPESKNVEFGIKYFLEQSENTLRDEDSDGNNNIEDTLEERRKPPPKPFIPKGPKTEEEKRFDHALTSSVNKVSFWFGSGVFDGDDFDLPPSKLSTFAPKSSSLKVRNDLTSFGSDDEEINRAKEQQFRNPVKIESNSEEEREMTKSNGLDKLKMKIKMDKTESDFDDDKVQNTDINNEKYSNNDLVERTEEVLEQSRSLLNSLLGSELAPPKKTFSMDPFSQKSNAATSKAPPKNPLYHPTPWKSKYVDPFSEVSPTKKTKTSNYPDIYDDDYGSLLVTSDSLANSKKSNETTNSSSSRNIGINGSNIERDSSGNYFCPKCKYSSKLRVQIVKHTCYA